MGKKVFYLCLIVSEKKCFSTRPKKHFLRAESWRWRRAIAKSSGTSKNTFLPCNGVMAETRRTQHPNRHFEASVSLPIAAAGTLPLQSDPTLFACGTAGYAHKSQKIIVQTTHFFE
jgi:hypothetical protein